MAQDKVLTLTDLSAKVFGGDTEAYMKWINGHHTIFGSLTASELLAKDPESWVVRDALLKLWLEKEGLVVPKPPVVPEYKQVMLEGGFFVWRRVEGASA